MSCEDVEDDLDQYQASILTRSSTISAADFQEAWLSPLVESQECLATESRTNSIKLAESEGVRLFSAADEGAVNKAAHFFHEHGFVILLDAVEQKTLKTLQHVCAGLIRRAVQVNPWGNRGHHRYSLHRTTMVRHCLEVADSEFLCATLEQIWDSPHFFVQCTGGDFSLPSAESQVMHADIGSRHRVSEYFAFRDPMHPSRNYCDLPAPVVKVYFPMVDLNEENGPTLFVPGSHWRYTQEDVPTEDPCESKRAFCPKGSAIVMDMRVWHRGTPNTSAIARPMLSVHYAGPWYSENVLKQGSMYWEYHLGALTHEHFQKLRPGLKLLCRRLLAWCFQCGRPAARHGYGSFKHQWYCQQCWQEWDEASANPKRIRKEASDDVQ